jgi:hypothetical protein
VVALLWGAGVLWSGYFEESKPVDGLLAISAGSWLSFLILGLEHPGSLTGDTHLRSGLVVLLSPIQNTSLPFAVLWFVLRSYRVELRTNGGYSVLATR